MLDVCGASLDLLLGFRFQYKGLGDLVDYNVRNVFLNCLKNSSSFQLNLTNFVFTNLVS